MLLCGKAVRRGYPLARIDGERFSISSHREEDYEIKQQGIYKVL
jgi:hypothetical protein